MKLPLSRIVRRVFSKKGGLDAALILGGSFLVTLVFYFGKPSPEELQNFTVGAPILTGFENIFAQRNSTNSVNCVVDDRFASQILRSAIQNLNKRNLKQDWQSKILSIKDLQSRLQVAQGEGVCWITVWATTKVSAVEFATAIAENFLNVQKRNLRNSVDQFLARRPNIDTPDSNQSRKIKVFTGNSDDYSNQPNEQDQYLAPDVHPTHRALTERSVNLSQNTTKSGVLDKLAQEYISVESRLANLEDQLPTEHPNLLLLHRQKEIIDRRIKKILSGFEESSNSVYTGSVEVEQSPALKPAHERILPLGEAFGASLSTPTSNKVGQRYLRKNSSAKSVLGALDGNAEPRPRFSTSFIVLFTLALAASTLLLFLLKLTFRTTGSLFTAASRNFFANEQSSAEQSTDRGVLAGRSAPPRTFDFLRQDPTSESSSGFLGRLPSITSDMGCVPNFSAVANKIAREFEIACNGEKNSPFIFGVQSIFKSISKLALANHLNVLVFTSSRSGAGTSTTIYGVAQFANVSGKSVLLVDANCWSASLTDYVKLLLRDRTIGCSDAIIPIEKNIDFTSISPNFPNRMSSAPTLPRVSDLSRLKKQYDLILVDAPSLSILDGHDFFCMDADAFIVTVRQSDFDSEIADQIDRVMSNLALERPWGFVECADQ
ncbi:hypothetical protein TRICHSKD4_3049 [Roseibium sp. TrichSKD4]|uniref:hypothetical protein n=1 Tax=Roseibium sp. TrichSKD4 TaxID=744980 RepID=UPI0001E56B27|nr:hypothetical protein [Roseibium sp. TrichSKD4]EFO31954.1 hypothetical protein TRICHSKD4_3049 [Roseibium sp. TrichSKD4]